MMASKLTQIFAIAKWEWQILRRERGFQVALLTLLILSGCAIQNGVQRQISWFNTVTRILSEQQSDRHFLLSAFEQETNLETIAGRTLSRNEQGRANTLRLVAKLPTSLAYFGGTTYALLIPSRLGSLSTLNIDRFPNRFLINAHSQRTVLERADQISPFSQMTGPFDLAMLIGIVVPLMVIVLCYDIVSAEREQGLLSLSTIQTTQPALRYGIKLLVRITPPTLILIASILLASWLSLTNSVEPSLTWRTAILCLATLMYLGCWGMLCLLVNTFNGSSATNALLLLSLWCSLVLLAPTGLSAEFTRRFATITGAELVQKEREIQADVRPQGRDLQAAYYEAHPEDRPEDANKDRFGQARWDIISHHVDRRMAEVIDRKYAGATLRQQCLARWQAISPAIAWRTLVDEISGVSEGQFFRFQQTARDFHTAFKAYFLPGMMSRREFVRSDVENMPRFTNQVAGHDLTFEQIADSLAVLLLWLIVASILTTWRLRHLRPI